MLFLSKAKVDLALTVWPPSPSKVRKRHILYILCCSPKANFWGCYWTISFFGQMVNFCLQPQPKLCILGFKGCIVDQCKINLGAFAEPNFIRNYLVWRHMFEFFLINAKSRFLEARIQYFSPFLIYFQSFLAHYKPPFVPFVTLFKAKMFVFRSGLRFSFWALEVPEPRVRKRSFQ